MAGTNPADHRKKWDKSHFDKLASEKLEEELKNIRKAREGVNAKRALLQARDYKINLESNLNRSQVITKTGPGSSQAGYYCEVCDCVIKDSINYLDHVNGKKHQRNLGMSMRIKRSTLDDVKGRFSKIKKDNEMVPEEYSLEERRKALVEEEEKAKAYKKEHKQAKKRKFERRDDTDLDGDLDVAATMGFANFGSSKKPC
ncbi:zinc finger, matrin-type 2 [Cichlidogyrus casuarinus]|uniref:Zinc finger, matrin-type 2 n=1 Tax=Cichlidogyrus casuarinus TaxID=1844966 RepID=A0ABD2QA90_9PLAT